jgi:ribosomal protein S18 acetylase RimI-like enzyme
MTVEIKRVGADNAALLDRVADGVFDEPVVPQRLAAFLADPGHHLFVALEDGVVVGQGAVVVHRHPDRPDDLYIERVGVAPTHQRRGIARALMRVVMALGRELGCAEVWLGTETDNTPARGLYESFDMKATSIIDYTLKTPDKP